MKDTFHLTEYMFGTTKISAGDVWRMNSFSPFGDAVVLGIREDGEVKVSRPYVYASSVGTTGPVPLLGTETYSLPAKHMVLHWEKKDSGRTV